MTKSKPSTSQEVCKLKGNILIESIGEFLEAKTISEIKINIATNAKDLKVDMNNLKSDNANNMDEPDRILEL